MNEYFDFTIFKTSSEYELAEIKILFVLLTFNFSGLKILIFVPGAYFPCLFDDESTKKLTLFFKLVLINNSKV